MFRFNFAIAYVSAALVSVKNRHEERGASMIEYALLVAAVAVMVGIVSKLFAGKISDFVTGITF